MDRLRNVIEKHRKWSELIIYIERIEANVETDFSQAIENIKALLESIAKEICDAKGVELGKADSINKVIKKAFTVIGYANKTMENQISSALATIAQNIGDLRNDVGAASHGKTMDELRDRNSLVDQLSREFLVDTAVIVATFMIRAYENNTPQKEEEEATLLYDDEDPFNEYWDDLYGEFEMGDYSFTASEIFYHVDYNDYMREHKAYGESEGEEN